MPDEQTKNLVALVLRLAKALRNADSGSELPHKAIDYLKRAGLQPSPLRKPN